MYCTYTPHTAEITRLFRTQRQPEAMFYFQLDDGRTVLVSGQYYERFELAEILHQMADQLADGASILV